MGGREKYRVINYIVSAGNTNPTIILSEGGRRHTTISVSARAAGRATLRTIEIECLQVRASL